MLKRIAYWVGWWDGYKNRAGWLGDRWGREAGIWHMFGWAAGRKFGTRALDKRSSGVV